MADWRERCHIVEDVCYFRYTSEGLEKNIDEVYVWDLDKTYLDTENESLLELISRGVERAFYKKNIPGTKALLHSLSKHYYSQRGQQRFPVFFITASPPQIEERISEKFAIDGFRPFGSFYKDNFRNLHPKRWWRLRKQVGYKLQALLQLRMKLKENVKQVLWGDDSEQDAVIYNLYSDICARRMSPSDIRATLKSLGVVADQVDQILLYQSQVPENDPVDKIYINLATDTDTDYYLKFGRRTLPTYNTFQVALDLFQDGRLSFEGMAEVAQDMIFNYGFTPDELVRSFDELVRRRVLGEVSVNKAVPYFIDKGLFPTFYKLQYQPVKEQKVEEGHVYEMAGDFEPWVPSRIDYLNDYR